MKKHDFRFNTSLIISKPKRQNGSPFRKQHQTYNYSSLPHAPKTIVEENYQYLSIELKKKLQSLIAQMLEKIQSQVSKEKSNLRLAMNYVRSSIVFKEIDQIDTRFVDQIVGDYVKNKLDTMEERLTIKSRELQQLKQELKYEHQFNQIRLKINSIHIRPHQNNIIGKLYSKAQDNSYEQFKEFYAQLHDCKTDYQSKLSSVLQKAKYKQPQTKANSFIKVKVQISQIDVKKLLSQLESFMHTLPLDTKSRLISALESKVACGRPCCRWENSDQQDYKPINCYLNRPIPKSNRSSSFYRNTDFQKFQSRYVTKNFKIDQFVSMTRTRTQQMDKYYSIFKKKQRSKLKEHQRNKSAV